MNKLITVIICLLAVCNLSAQVTSPAGATSLKVAKDGSGNYKTIQEAINAVRDLSGIQVQIHIKNGVYDEKVVIPSWKTKVSLIGESEDGTIITGNDYSGKTYSNGKDPYGNSKFSTYTSSTVLVEGDDFVAENLTIRNTAGRVGQAVALHIEGDRAIIKNCKLLGNQDTLYTASSSSRQYYENCFIEGTTDFIFGEATCVFKGCTIKSLTNSYVTAASTTPKQQYGYVFFNCKLIADTSATKVYLGRPWRPYAKTVFINCELGSHIVAEGWNPWKGDSMFPDKEKTAYYAEYGNTGPGASTTGRVPWAKQLTRKEAKKYTVNNILGPGVKWSFFD